MKEYLIRRLVAERLARPIVEPLSHLLDLPAWGGNQAAHGCDAARARWCSCGSRQSPPECVRLEKGEVLYLGEGAVHDAVFDGVYGTVRILSPDLHAFLERLLADVEAFVSGEEGWEYMV